MPAPVDTTDQDTLSPTTMVMKYLMSKGMQPSNPNYAQGVRTALEENARNPGLIPGLVNNAPSTEAQDQAAMRAAGVGAPRGGGGGRTSAAPARPGVPVAPSDDTFFPNAPPGTVPGALPVPPIPPPGGPPSNDTFFPNGQPTGRAAGKPAAAPPPAAQAAAPAPMPPPPSDDTFLPNQPPAAAAAAAAPASNAPGLGVVLPRIGNDIVSGTNSVMDRIRSMIAQRPPAAAAPPAPAEPPGPATPLPWVVRELMDQSRRSNVNPAPGVPTVRSPTQIYGGVPDAPVPLPPPANPADPTRPMQQQPTPVVQPPPGMSGPPDPLNAALQRALEDRTNQAIMPPAGPRAPVMPPQSPVVASPPPVAPQVIEAQNTRRPRRSLFASRS